MGGQFRLRVIGTDGKVKQDTGWKNNLIVNAGLPVLAGLAINTDSQTAFGYLEVGTDATAVAAAQTALVAAITTGGLARAAGTKSRVTTTVANDTAQLYYLWTSSAVHAVEEIGIFNASSGGTMLCRALTTTINVGNGEKLEATYKVKFLDDGA